MLPCILDLLDLSIHYCVTAPPEYSLTIDIIKQGFHRWLTGLKCLDAIVTPLEVEWQQVCVTRTLLTAHGIQGSRVQCLEQMFVPVGHHF